MDLYVLRKSYPHNKIFGKRLFVEKVTFWSKTPKKNFAYNDKTKTFWGNELNENVIKHSYIVMVLKWKFSGEDLEIPFIYEIVREEDAIVEKIVNE